MVDDPVYCQLLHDLENHHMQVSIICLGIKASGKSTRALAFVRYCLEHTYYNHPMDTKNDIQRHLDIISGKFATLLKRVDSLQRKGGLVP